MRVAAPIASLSGPRIDTVSDHLPIPSRSMVTGIIGAALGLGYDQPETLQKVQDSMRLAVVVHRAGRVVRDYQTVRMGLPHMVGPMWWNDGQRLGVMKREGGDPERTITGERPLTCDYDATIIVELLPGAPFPSRHLERVARARAPTVRGAALVYPISADRWRDYQCRVPARCRRNGPARDNLSSSGMRNQERSIRRPLRFSSSRS